MRRTGFWRVGAFVVLALGGYPGSSLGELGLIGVSPAEAKAYYTKKRVNGRWITGRFPKRGWSEQSASRRQPAEPRRAARARIQVAAASDPALVPDATPVTQPRVQSPPAMLAQSAVPASSIQATPPAANAPPLAAAEDERLDKLRQALKARASALTTGSVAQPAVRPAPEPQSVSLDFKSGIKTTLFSDGTAVTEPFDVTALKGLAAMPAEARAGH